MPNSITPPTAYSHMPVMLGEVLSAIKPTPGQTFIDATFGGGGYTQAILATSDTRVLGIDRDPAAIRRGRDMAKTYADGRLMLQQGGFADMVMLADAAGLKPGQVDGIVFDVGVSSYQIDDPDRGFSFSKDGPLDMRMGDAGETAADVVNTYTEADLADMFYYYGDEPKARQLARAIVQRRATEAFTRTLPFANFVAAVLKAPRQARIHPATRVFQALRIHVNNELYQLDQGLAASTTLIKAGGRLVVVSFHSLEDRRVKEFFQDARNGFQPTTRGAIKPTEAEIATNPRSRSARLRTGIRQSKGGA